MLIYGLVGAMLLVIYLTMGVEESMRRGLLVLFLVGAFLGSLVLGYSLDRLVARPVQRLVDQVRKAVDGGWDRQLQIPKWRGEITELGVALEELRSAMMQKQEDLNKLNEELEERVRRRGQELEQTHAQLVEAGKLAGLGRLAAGVAHEVNNPTGIVLTRAGYLLSVVRESGGDPALLEDLEVIEEQARRISSITRSLLDFGRLADSSRSEVDLHLLCKETVGLLQHRAHQNGVEVELLAPSGSAHAWGSRDELGQVLFNLLTNAIDANAARVEIEMGAGFVVVTDDGSGVPESDLPRLFEPFFSTKPQGEGTGLGLSISWGIVARHGGTIKVDSKEGSGTSMRVILPEKEVCA